MMRTRRRFRLVIVVGCLGICLWNGCNGTEDQELTATDINTTHLDHLYETIVMPNGDSVGIIHIYCEYPDYEWVGDGDEGIACVDDAARAAVFYLRNYRYTGAATSLKKGRMLIQFLLSMQSDNGYFYNFIWPDHTINRDGKTSSPRPDWWSWRTFWAFGEALSVIKADEDLYQEIELSRDRLVQNIMTDFSKAEVIDTIDGLPTPTWLPHGSATDQAALILMGLSFMSPADDGIRQKMEHFARGLALMQVHNPDGFPNAAFRSWQGIWHAYGNSQAYVLFRINEILKDKNLGAHALNEVDQYYPALWSRGGLNYFRIGKTDNKFTILEEQTYAQIAYGIRPMIWACLEAWKITEDRKYLEQARKYGKWFAGDNPAHTQMYDPETGRGYDGILNEREINKNAGAESTIEALLALQELEQYMWD